MTDATLTPDQLAERNRQRIKGALARYRFMAYFTGVCLLLLCAEIVYKYMIAADPDAVPGWLGLIGFVHGWGYVVYIGLTIDLGLKARWKPARFLLTLLAGTIPLASFYFEHINTREVRARFKV